MVGVPLVSALKREEERERERERGRTEWEGLPCG